MQALIDDLIFELKGEKVFSFLHGQLSNDIKGMQSSASSFNFLLNTKGKIQAALFVYRESEKCFIAVPEVCATALIEHLQKLAGLSGVQINPKPDWQIVHVIADAPFASDVVAAKTASAASVDDSVLAAETMFKISTNRFNEVGFDHFVEKNLLTQARSFLKPEEIEVFRIRQGVPRFGADYSSQHLPQETEMWQGLHFDKGCYLGQEIVARLQYRGQVKKHLVRFVAADVKVQANSILHNVVQEEVGQVTSWVFDAAKNCTIGLAWLQTSAAAKADEVNWQGHPVKIFPLALQSNREPVRIES